MPYRAGDSCALCHDVSAKGRCARCDAPLCEAHAHGSRRRCGLCEQQFEPPAEPTNLVDWVLRAAIAISLGGIFVTALLIGFATPTSFVTWRSLFLLSPWFVLALALVIFALVLGVRAPVWYARWRFLRDRLARGHAVNVPALDLARSKPRGPSAQRP